GFGGQGGGGAGGSGFRAQSTSASTSSRSSGSSLVLSGENGGDPRVKVVADEAKNAILIEATQDDYRRIMRVISSLDTMPKQVLIEATIAEITLNDDLKFGLRWYVQGSKATYTFSEAASGAVSSVFPGFSYALTAANVAATLNTLNKVTDVNIVSSPTLTVM